MAQDKELLAIQRIIRLLDKHSGGEEGRARIMRYLNERFEYRPENGTIITETHAWAAPPVPTSGPYNIVVPPKP